jgi:metal transporter CNNM
MLGAHDEPTTYRKAELKTFVSLGVEDTLGEDEVALLGSVLEFSGKTVLDIMVCGWFLLHRVPG